MPGRGLATPEGDWRVEHSAGVMQQHCSIMHWHVIRARFQRVMSKLPARPTATFLQEAQCPAHSDFSYSHRCRISYTHENEKVLRVALAVRTDAQMKVREVTAERNLVIARLKVNSPRLDIASVYILHEASPLDRERPVESIAD